MPSFSLSVADVLLAILAFLLGIAATVISQLTARRLGYADARRRLRYQYLHSFRDWKEAYRELLKCRYPEIYPLWLGPLVAPSLGVPIGKIDSQTATAILQDLRDFWERRQVAAKAEENAIDAVNALIKRPFPTAPYPLRLFLSRRWNPYTEFGTEVIVDLQKFHTLHDRLYESIERSYAQATIDWNRLGVIAPDDLASIVASRLLPWRRHLEGTNHSDPEVQKYADAYEELRDILSSITSQKREANEHLDSIFSVIRRYEVRWVVPNA